MNIIDFIINLFPKQKNRYQTQTDKTVNLTVPGTATTAGGGLSTDQNPTGTGGAQGQTVGTDGLTSAERLKIRSLKTYNDKLAAYRILAADYNKKFNDKIETASNMLKYKAALLKLKSEVALALNAIKTYSEYEAAKMNFEAIAINIGSYKVKTIV